MSVFVLVFLRSWLQDSVHLPDAVFKFVNPLWSEVNLLSVHSHKAFEHMQIASGVLLEVFAVEICVPYVALKASADAAGTNRSFPYTDIVDTAKPHPCTTIRVIFNQHQQTSI